jgi:hypothetical protein
MALLTISVFKRVALAAGLICLSTAALAAEKQYLSQEGHWEINVAESKVPPEGFKLPMEPFDVTKDDGKVLEFTTYKTTPKGLEVAFTYAGAYDGKPYPAGPGGTTAMYQHITASSFYTETRVANGMVFSEHGFILDGGNKFRLEAKAINDKGKLFDYVLVYDKKGPPKDSTKK